MFIKIIFMIMCGVLIPPILLSLRSGFGELDRYNVKIASMNARFSSEIICMYLESIEYKKQAFYQQTELSDDTASSLRTEIIKNTKARAMMALHPTLVEQVV